MKTLFKEEIHLPDLSFIRLCESQYGINRGIYNTIDTWFYEQGLRDIVERRTKILSFLTYIQGNSTLDGNSPLHFGHGGLSIKLQEYCSAAYKGTCA